MATMNLFSALSRPKRSGSKFSAIRVRRGAMRLDSENRTFAAGP
jgi:hypothetical protein